MKITGIEKITCNDDVVEVFIGIEFAANKTNTWELEAPNILVTYDFDDNLRYRYMYLIDRGIMVHGYEFVEHEEKEILDYLETKGIRKKVNIINNDKQL